MRILPRAAAVLWTAAALGADPGRIEVTVEVDYGLLGRPAESHQLRLPPGSSVLDATRACMPTRQGYVCCDKDNVTSIGGVACDAEREAWWLYDLNRQYGTAAAHRMRLEDGDRVTWRYVVRGSQEETPLPIYRESGAARAGGAMAGVVRAEGTVPEAPPFDIHKNHAACGLGLTVHPCARPAPRGRLAEAVARLETVERGKAWRGLPRTAVLDQVSCHFEPHLIVLPVGGVLEVRNSDPVRHTVDARAADGRTAFKLVMPRAGVSHRLTLDTPGVFALACDAGHFWMKAHLVVVQNPYVAVTGEDGRWRLDHVPPGRYRLLVWHDWFGERARDVEVAAGGVTAADTAFAGADFTLDLRYAGGSQ